MKAIAIGKMPENSVKLALVGVTPILLFGVFTAIVGGEALSGRIERGNYYLAEGAALKEVSFPIYALSAGLCIFASLGLFLLVNRILHILERQRVIRKERLLPIALNVLFGAGCAALALCSISVLVQAIIERFAHG